MHNAVKTIKKNDLKKNQLAIYQENLLLGR